MSVLQNPRARQVRQVHWLHRLFVKGDYALSCDVDVRGDGTFVATLFPLWEPGDQVTELFQRQAEAMQWHAEMMHRLHAAGWLLLEGRAVTTAA